MAVHFWGEENFDWRGINDAAEFIGEGLKRWGRVDVHQYKEKFGGVRVYCFLGLGSFEQLVRPGYAFLRWPEWAIGLDLSVMARLLRTLLNLAIVPYHRWLYRRFYRLAVERWPHLHDEILDAADVRELLEGL